MTDGSTTQKHVLVVEDDPDFADLLQSILSSAGYSVSAAYSFESAFSQVREATPDLITLDLQLVRRSGMLFYRKLKEDERFRDIPVVVVTGISRDDEDLEEAIRRVLTPKNVPPPEAYLDKPVDGPTLLTAVAQAFSGR